LEGNVKSKRILFEQHRSIKKTLTNKNEVKNKKSKNTAKMVSLDEMINNVLSYEIASDLDFLELTEFAGYKPETIFQAIYAKLKTEDDKKHLQLIIFFGHTRGFGGGKSWTTLIERTSSASGKKMLETCRTKFSIVMKKTKLTDVTIDRLMGAFPSVTFAMWKKLCDMGKGNSKLPGYDGSLPEKFRYPGSPAAMSATAWRLHRDAYLDWSLDLQALWRVQNPSRDNIEKFADLQFQNVLFPHSRRID
jgi:hypothetical protein